MTDTKTQEEVEFYSAGVNAWYNSALEHDKSLLTLSAGGIGLLITILTTVGIKTYYALILYSLAIVCFIICLIAVLLIFSGNRKHIVEVFQGRDSLDDPYLVRLDKVAFWTFVAGVVLTALIGITTAFNQFPKKEIKMTDKKIVTAKVITQDKFDKTDLISKSFNGVQGLKPSTNTSNTQTESNTQSSQTNSSGNSQAAQNQQADACDKKK